MVFDSIDPNRSTIFWWDLIAQSCIHSMKQICLSAEYSTLTNPVALCLHSDPEVK